MLHVKIEHRTYKAGPNNTTRHSYQARVEDDYGTVVEQTPVRDSYESAEDDARNFRAYIREQEQDRSR